MDDAQREEYISQAKDGMYHELTTTKTINGDTHRATAEHDADSIHLESNTAETLLTSSEA
jgi:adenylyl- and sulfurtransferase ThiI